MFNLAYTQTQLAVGAVVAQIVDPGVNTSFPGYTLANNVLGWLKWLGLAGSLASFFIGGAVWGLSQQGGNSMAASRGRSYALGGAAGAVVIGLGATIVNQLSTVGMSLRSAPYGAIRLKM